METDLLISLTSSRRHSHFCRSHTYAGVSYSRIIAVPNHERTRLFLHTCKPEHTRGGVTVVINKQKLPTSNITTHEIIPGHALLVCVPWRENITLNVLAVYAPNRDMTENAQFWNDLMEQWANPDTRLPNVNILLGDFNVVETAIDRSPPHPDAEAAVNALWNLKTTLGVSDGWRASNPPPDVDFTFKQRDTPSLSRIDRIYADDRNIERVVHSAWKSIPYNWTDHQLVIAKLAHSTGPAQGHGRWSLPTWLLDNKTFISNVEQHDRTILAQLHSTDYTRCSTDNPQTKLQGLIEHTTKVAKTMHCKASGKLKTLINRHKCEYKKLLNRPPTEPDENHEAHLNMLHSRIEDLETTLHERWRTAGSANYRLWGEQVNKYWTNFGKEAKTQDPISSISKATSAPVEYTHDSKEMASEMAKFHDQLQRKNLEPNSEGWLLTVDETLANIKRAPAKLTQPLEQKLSYEEVRRAINSCSPQKAPGLDGIPSEFYKKLNVRWEQSKDSPSPALDICALLQCVYNDIENHGTASDNFLRGWLCPVYKKGDPCEPTNYRPITVLNTCYKIFTTALLKKLTNITPNLIHTDQAGFIPRRSIVDQVDLAKAMIDLCEITEQEGVIVALDQEKAYDRIRHDYLWIVLAHFGLPPSFINTIKALYTSAKTSVMVNGELSDPFLITRGVRQGDPISCLLFNLAIEPLASMIRNSPELNGLTIQKTENTVQRIIVSLFADDTTVYLSCGDSFRSLQNILDTWCFASGAHFNCKKTVIIPVGPKTYRDNVALTRSLDGTPDNRIDDSIAILQDGESTRLLGAQVGNDIDQVGVWTHQIEKIRSALNRWDAIHPTFQGRSHIIRMIVGGMTQYLTAAQGMPNCVCDTLAKLIRNFFWGNAHSTVAEQYLFLPIVEGGWNLLDIRSRNDAIALTKLKRLTDFGPSRPAWADAAFVIFIASIPQSERARGDERSMHTPLLQRIWQRDQYGGLPMNLRTILNTAATYKLLFKSAAYPLSHRLELPAWHHIGSQPGSRQYINYPHAKCLCWKHAVHTTEDLLLHAYQYVAEDHQNDRYCICQGCLDARSQGCDEPSSCFRTAALLLDRLDPTFDPRNEIPLLPLPDRAYDLLNNPEEEWSLFDKATETKGKISANFRIFTENINPHLPFDTPENRLHNEAGGDGLEYVYTDGSCDTNDNLDARAGSGLWYGTNNPRNRAIRVGNDLPQTNNSGEMLAIYHAAKNASPGSTLCIITDSKWAIQTLTTYLDRNEDQGYIRTRNADLVRATAATLKARNGHTQFKWIKDHNGTEGNEGADRLAQEGVQMEGVESSQLTAPPALLIPGIKLATSSQALLYQGIRAKRNHATPTRASRNLNLTCLAAINLCGVKPSNAKIWTAITKNNNLSRNVRSFLWKCVYDAHKCGPYWQRIPGYEQRAECSLCGEIETMDHIMFRCDRGTGQSIWMRIRAMCEQKGMDWPEDFDLFTIMASPFACFEDNQGRRHPGANRLFQIVVSEAAFLIWKLRCKRKFNRDEDTPERAITDQEATNALAFTLNGRLSDDRLLTNRKRYGKKALTPAMVLSTWSGTLRDEDHLPMDWLYGQSGVLVGMTPRRLNGQNR